MRRRMMVPAAAMVLAGCAAGPGWSRIPQGDLPPLPVREQAQVWSRGHSQQLHGIRVTRDSISGVPFFQDPRCDSCRVSLARAEVDSVRVGGPGMDAAGATLAGLGVGLFVFLLVVFSALSGMET
jgi:hypothetical protein